MLETLCSVVEHWGLWVEEWEMEIRRWMSGRWMNDGGVRNRRVRIEGAKYRKVTRRVPVSDCFSVNDDMT
jgi:CO dehydrogenase/acetyl-CoA synthase delta subunit